MAALEETADAACWFQLAGAQALKGRHDVACLCFFRADNLAEEQGASAEVGVSMHQSDLIVGKRTGTVTAVL